MDMHYDGMIFQTHPRELARRLRYPHPPFAVLDVREPSAFERDHIPGARRLELAELEEGLPSGITPATELFVLGRDLDDARVRRASRALLALGARRVVELTGGMAAWQASGQARPAVA